MLFAFVAFLYYRPLTSYVETRAELDRRAAEVRSLRVERRKLMSRLDAGSSERALGREARRLGLVRPGERLFVVKGVEQWRRAHRTAVP
ncbi:MAG: septum formation initiator family protein [Gaiellaceae bacterium]